MENIKSIIKEFIDFIERGCSSIEENEKKLRQCCSKLEQSISSISWNSIKTYSSPNIVLSQKASRIKKLVHKRFPHFGHYSFTDPGNGREEAPLKDGLVTGNAIDDITTITNVFYEILGRLENINTSDALFYLEDNFKFCWGGNFKNLQIYLNS
jgi:hypothetical protein